MLQYKLTGLAARPMPDRINAWGIFDLFETADDVQVFLGVVTDSQWAVFGRAFDLNGLADDPRLANNNIKRSDKVDVQLTSRLRSSDTDPLPSLDDQRRCQVRR